MRRASRPHQSHDGGFELKDMGNGNIDHRSNARRITAVIPQSIERLGNDDALRRDAADLSERLDLSPDDRSKMEKGAFLARDAYVWDRIVNGDPGYLGRRRPGGITIGEDVEQALREERYKLYSKGGIRMVTTAVMCAAFLQGCVQSSINGSSLYIDELNIDKDASNSSWILGLTNSMPFFSAALLGCWLSIPINHYWGRRGAMLISAVLVGVTSLLAGLIPVMIENSTGPRWQILLVIRVFNGIGMGIKAVSTPILASETAIQFWRGSSVLNWQLWVACGIMVGFVFNLITTLAPNNNLTIALILGAPAIPAIVLIFALWRCPESPRYYLRREKPNYGRALEELRTLRSNCELLAYRDMYLLYKSIHEECKYKASPQLAQHDLVGLGDLSQGEHPSFLQRLSDLFTRPRLRNALTSSSTVALAQQFCGINVSAFYSGTLFVSLLAHQDQAQGPSSAGEIKQAMGLSLGFGAVNFFFGLPAIRTIDSLGRRKWLISTLPLMCIFMAAAAVDCYLLDVPEPLREFSNDIIEASVQAFRVRKVVIVATCLYLHAIAYSPGLGPIPFTLASESFPLSHREIGCAFAIAVNLFFAGVLSICIPALNSGLQSYGLLALFCGLTFVALVMVYLLVEETKQLSLEQLNEVFDSSKSQFVKDNARRAWWWIRRFTWPDPRQPRPPVSRRRERYISEPFLPGANGGAGSVHASSRGANEGEGRTASAGHNSGYDSDPIDPDDPTA